MIKSGIVNMKYALFILKYLNKFLSYVLTAVVHFESSKISPVVD